MLISKLKPSKSLVAVALFTAFAATVAFHILRFNNTNSVSEEDEEHETPGTNPGWIEQWRTMKGLKEGEEIPMGMYRQWQAADNKARKKNESTGLCNIKEIGPYNIGGRTRGILIDKADPNRLLACGISGGIWESTNRGNSWNPINDNAATLSATSITQSPFDYNIIYYGTGEVASNTAGISGEGLFKSTDGGASFTQLESSIITPFKGIWRVEHSLVDSNTVFVATSNNGLYRTTTAGDTFEQVFQSGVDVHDIEVMPDGGVFIAVESRGVFYSPNGEPNTFTETKKGLPSGGFNRVELAYCQAFPKVIYALFAKGTNGYNGACVGVWKSSNGGKTWNEAGNPGNTGENFGFPWYCLSMGVDLADTNLVVVGSAGYTYTKNGGQTWQRGRDSHADYHCFAFYPDRNGVFLAGNDGGIYEYNWSTISFQYNDRNNNYNVTQFYAGTFAPDSLGVLAGAQDNNSLYGFQGKSSFNVIYGGDGGFCHINQQHPDIAYVTSQNGNIRKTGTLNIAIPSTVGVMGEMDANFDGTIDDGAWFENPYEMSYYNGDLLFFPTRRRLWYTFDGAQSWSVLTNLRVNLYAVGIPQNDNPNKVYVGGDNLSLYRIDDFYNASPGDEVSLSRFLPNQLNGGFIACITVHPRNDGTIYLALSNMANAPRVWRIDSAQTDKPVWTPISGDLPKGLPANWIEVDPYRPDDYLIVATDFGLYTTKNGGETWLKEERIPNVAIQNIRMRKTDRKLFVYTHGRGIFAANMKKMDDPFFAVEEVKTNKLHIYPNPVENEIKVELEGTFTYHIYNTSGQLLMQGKGSNLLTVGTLPKGNYQLVVMHKNARYQSQFVKL
ncbi:T9SS type A sorting domain-containing protein [bacterium]|nr:T9SS type A sorting domain-containing protein [bacterium]